MPLGLRVVRKARWLREDWLLRNRDIPSAALGDLLDDRNAISIYLISEDQSNFQRVIAAHAATRDHVVNLDYALFDLATLSSLRIAMEHENGTTADDTVNRDFHRNLVRLSARSVFFLAQTIHSFGEPVRINHKDVLNHIMDALDSNYLDPSKIKASILQAVAAKPH
jgi:hypothetical protein